MLSMIKLECRIESALGVYLFLCKVKIEREREIYLAYSREGRRKEEQETTSSRIKGHCKACSSSDSAPSSSQRSAHHELAVKIQDRRSQRGRAPVDERRWCVSLQSVSPSFF